MLRSEIAKLAAELRATGPSSDMMHVQHTITCNAIADRLTTILDADPITRLEELDRSVILMGQADGTIRVSAVYLDEQSETVEAGAHPDAIHDAAARIYDRIRAESKVAETTDDP